MRTPTHPFSLVVVLLAVAPLACRWPSPVAPETPGKSTLVLRALAQEPVAERAHVQWGAHETWTGPPHWQLPPELPWGSLIRVDFESSSHEFQPLLFARGPETPPWMPMVPTHQLDDSVYVDQIDLLQEFLWSFSGSRILRWKTETLRVSLPVNVDEVDYAAACADAMDTWNQALGVTRFTVNQDEWDVVCEVSNEPRLAYTELLERDENDLPLTMRVHVSPLYAPGSEAYVRRVYLHEFGHVLGLWNHSRERAHIMNGVAVTADSLHTDEVRAARWFWSLPNGIDLVALGRRWPPKPPPKKATRPTTATECGTAVIHPGFAATDSTR